MFYYANKNAIIHLRYPNSWIISEANLCIIKFCPIFDIYHKIISFCRKLLAVLTRYSDMCCRNSWNTIAITMSVNRRYGICRNYLKCRSP
jgi:hypothetical protein